MKKPRITWPWAVVLLTVFVALQVRFFTARRTIPPVPVPTLSVTATPFAPPPSVTPAADALFRPCPAEQTGIHYVHAVDVSHPWKCLYFSGFASGGLAIGDVDRDGRPDVFIAGGPGPNCLYRQRDRLQFEDITTKAGVAAPNAWCSGVAMVDLNNDGYLDIYVCCYDSPNLFYENQGDGTFRECAAEYGINITDASMSPAFADYDRDGDLDLYLMTYRYENPQGWPRQPPLSREGGKTQIVPELQRYYEVTHDETGFGPVGRADGLLRNNGDRTFSDVTLAAGIAGLGHGLSAIWWDYNDDGWPDLYVGNDFRDPDCLYENQRNGTFKNVIAQAIPHTTWFSMGSAVADFDNDLRPDLVIADMANTTHFKQKLNMGNMGVRRDFLDKILPRQQMSNAYYHNTGTGHFLEIAQLAGIARTDWTWAVKAGDWNNDGQVDLFFSNGSIRAFTNADIRFDSQIARGRTTWDLYEAEPVSPERDLVFLNQGKMMFGEMGTSSGITQATVSMATAQGDLDGDGDLDLVVARLDEPVQIIENMSQHRSVIFQLVGRQSNRFGWGARVTIDVQGKSQTRWLNPLSGFLASDDPLMHFGVGEAAQIDHVKIEWPTGQVQELTDLPSQHRYTVVEPLDSTTPAVASSPETLFQRDDDKLPARHQERPFDDFAGQPLLPFRMSQWGPASAWSDVDGDGDDDFFLGGATGQAGQLWRNDAAQGFHRIDCTPLSEDAAAEDLGAVWGDYDQDGDEDLYVVSGGVEAGNQPTQLADRLYWNQGNWSFTRATSDELPLDSQSGGTAVAADFDRDGDLDLFVGGRLQPNQYPSPAPNQLLVNQGGHFRNQVDAVAPALASTGMVTSALWSDVNQDGWIDLLLTHEWGPVRLWINDSGKLVEQTQPYGLAERQGWWQGITGGDVDHDGDIDYVVTNMGLNTKYHASPAQPFRLFYGDMDGSHHPQIVEAEYEGEILFPVRGRSCTTQAIPSLAKAFPTYRSFAQAALSDLYTEARLNQAYALQANCLESGVLRNDAGKFTWQALPRESQTAPGFGVRCAFFDDDANMDLLMVQNFYGPQVETGRFDGGLGVLLRGDGHGQWKCIEPSQSGIIIPEDAKSLTLSDVNGDGKLDAIVGVNDGGMVVETIDRESPRVALRLIGPRGNLAAAGAVVRLKRDGQVVSTCEAYAGDGYLGQSTSRWDIPTPLANGATVEVTWPDGSIQTMAIPPAAVSPPAVIPITVRHPATASASGQHE